MIPLPPLNQGGESAGRFIVQSVDGFAEGTSGQSVAGCRRVDVSTNGTSYSLLTGRSRSGGVPRPRPSDPGKNNDAHQHCGEKEKEKLYGDGKHGSIVAVGGLWERGHSCPRNPLGAWTFLSAKPVGSVDILVRELAAGKKTRPPKWSVDIPVRETRWERGHSCPRGPLGGWTFLSAFTWRVGKPALRGRGG